MTLASRLLMAVYSVSIEAITWTALVPLTIARIAVGRTSPGELRDRLGRTAVPRRADGAVVSERPVLIHAVSAGEMNAADPIVTVLGRLGRRVRLSTGTRAGMAAADRMSAAHAHVDGCAFLPWDRRAVRRWLRAIDPSLVVIMETEIWPNLFTSCAALGIPLIVANGRVPTRDVPRYRLARGFFRDVLRSAAWIGAQSDLDREAFVAIGADPSRVETAGNLKAEAALASRPISTAVAARLHAGLTIVGGSTHDPEEAWLLDACCALRRGGRAVRLVVAPRDITRSARVARLASRRSLVPARWSAAHVRPGRSDWDVLIVDEYGWLPSFYQAADLVFVGGTLTSIGGHNVLEPAALGHAVIVGPDVHGIETVVRQLDAAGGIIRLNDRQVSSLVAACEALINDPARRRAIEFAARDAIRCGTRSTGRYHDVMLTAISAPTPHAHT